MKTGGQFIHWKWNDEAAEEGGKYLGSLQENGVKNIRSELRDRGTWKPMDMYEHISI